MTGRRVFLAASAGAAATWFVPECCPATPVALSPFVRREIDNLLKPGLQAIETGYQRLENGLLMMSALNKMVGCKFRMLDWWVRNYTAEDYKRWHPEHISAEFGGPYRILSEKIGSGPTGRLKFEVLDPTDYFDAEVFSGFGCGGRDCRAQRAG